MFNDSDLNNIVVLVDFAFANGMVQSEDDAKVLIMLKQKAREHMEEEEDGDDISASSE